MPFRVIKQDILNFIIFSNLKFSFKAKWRHPKGNIFSKVLIFILCSYNIKRKVEFFWMALKFWFLLIKRMATFNVPLEHLQRCQGFFNEGQATVAIASTSCTLPMTTAPLTTETSTRSTHAHYVDRQDPFANYRREPTTENEELLNWLFPGPADPGPAFTTRSKITIEEDWVKACKGREQNNYIWQPRFPRRKTNKK